MSKICVLIPTYKRPEKLKELVNNFYLFSTQSKLYFIIDPSDKKTIAELKSIQQKTKYDFEIFEVVGEYVKAINLGVKLTKEPFVFCGADDILFTADWDLKLLKVMADETINVTGGIDDWTCSKSGVHVSHPLIRRSYIDGIGSYWGGNEGVYFSGYKHYQCDIELEQLAWARNCFRLCKEVTIYHNHYVNHKVSDDETYKKSRLSLKDDSELYNKRAKNFEVWDTQKLHQGYAVESKYIKKRLSIVMPIWNCEEYVIKTIKSLVANTKHKYELILIDDKSTEFNGEKLLKKLKEMALKGGFINVITEANKEQKYCNANWNRGVELSTGNYIAIINSDIEFLTLEWDDYLIENIDFGYDLASPFQKDRVYPGEPYMLPPPTDVCHKMHLRSACFMLSKQFAKKVLPIPSRYTHWCGDNYISYNAKTWLFDIRVAIYHYISKSGEKVDQLKFWKMVKQDCVNWGQDSVEDMTQIIANCDKRIENNSKYGNNN